jgi:anti-sigma regulatory factor (Ser/Thr protein kinase)
MTSKGNEEIAVKALQLGAASYSPKSTLARDLVETVRSVLSVSGQQRTSARLLECMTKSECSFVLENDASLIAPLVGYLQDDAMRLGLCDDAERVRVGVALDEALVNALYHGNLELSSELRDSDGRAYHALINQRGEQSPYRDRRIFVDATLSSKEAVINIRDEGPGFDPSNLPDPLEPTNLERMGGRGVLLMRTFMDDVLYNQSGNQVTLIKRASKSSGEQQDGN